MSHVRIDLPTTTIPTISTSPAEPHAGLRTPSQRLALQVAERAYLGVITLAAAFVAYLGFAAPKRMDESFTWAVMPPMHARFVASLYLFGAVYVGACTLSRRRAQIGPVHGGIVAFTGLLFTLTMLNLQAFDFDLAPVWVWTVSYVVYPILGVALIAALSRSGVSTPVELAADAPLARWATTVLQAWTAVFGAAGLLLLVARGTMVDAWPWKVSSGLAQFYAAPILAIAFCCWRYATRTTWQSVRTIAPALFVFGVATLASSIVHRSLFDLSEPADVVWFAGFAALTLASAAVCVGAFVADRQAVSARP